MSVRHDSEGACLVTGRARTRRANSARPCSTSTARSRRCWWSATRTASAEGHDHREGHPEGHRASARLQGRAGRLRVGAAVGTFARYARARGGTALRPVSTSSWSTPPTATRAACSTDGRQIKHQDALAGAAGHRRQHRDRCEAARDLVKRRRRCGQGRHRPGLDLHHPHRRRRRRAADLGGRGMLPRRWPRTRACR